MVLRECQGFPGPRFSGPSIIGKLYSEVWCSYTAIQGKSDAKAGVRCLPVASIGWSVFVYAELWCFAVSAIDLAICNSHFNSANWLFSCLIEQADLFYAVYHNIIW